MREADFQKNLVKELKRMFPGCIVMKTDSSLHQGIPDLLILYKDKWAALEVKRDLKSRKKALQPNQEIRVKKMNQMSYASFIFPENKEEVLHDLAQTFRS